VLTLVQLQARGVIEHEPRNVLVKLKDAVFDLVALTTPASRNARVERALQTLAALAVFVCRLEVLGVWSDLVDPNPDHPTTSRRVSSHTIEHTHARIHDGLIGIGALMEEAAHFAAAAVAIEAAIGALGGRSA
jgi:hypothetical protein